MSQAPDFSPYHPENGILVPPTPVNHRAEEYDPQAFAVLRDMQHRHFWYRGRHRFILDSFREHVSQPQDLSAIDLGSGCGGWLSYLQDAAVPFEELALGDSSRQALELAQDTLGRNLHYYQVDLLDLHWVERWNVTFLLDVLEHIPEHALALQQVQRALKPGGWLFLTVPALDFFWSYNDELVGHQRRYSKRSMATLAQQCGFEVVDQRYFMFTLSPLLFATRSIDGLRARRRSEAEKWEMMKRAHRVPKEPFNGLLGRVLEGESALARRLNFPWGTSLLTILQKK